MSRGKEKTRKKILDRNKKRGKLLTPESSGGKNNIFFKNIPVSHLPKVKKSFLSTFLLRMIIQATLKMDLNAAAVSNGIVQSSQRKNALSLN